MMFILWSCVIIFIVTAIVYPLLATGTPPVPVCRLQALFSARGPMFVKKVGTDHKHPYKHLKSGGKRKSLIGPHFCSFPT